MPESENYECFLAGEDISAFALQSVIVKQSGHEGFGANLSLTRAGKSFEIDCPIAGALALAVRRNAPIVAHESVLTNAAIDISESG